jgi:hypothetical protein
MATNKGVAQKWLIVSAVKEFIGMESDLRGEQYALNELRREVYDIKRRVSSLREDIELLGELLSFYIYHWIGYTPRLSKDERVSLAVEAKERHERFMALFAKKLSSGELSLGALLARGVTPELSNREHHSDTKVDSPNDNGVLVQASPQLQQDVVEGNEVGN